MIHPERTAAGKRQKNRLLSALFAAGTICALGAAAWPFAAQTLSCLQAQQTGSQYLQTGRSTDQAALFQKEEQYRQVNDWIKERGFQWAWQDENNIPSALQSLLPGKGEMVAALEIPAIGLNLPVYFGTDSAVLEKGAGLLEGSSLPVGGCGSHAVMTGHTGLQTALLFSKVNRLKEGDRIVVKTPLRAMTYEVIRMQTVLPEEAGRLEPADGQDLITLITCTPYGINSHRLLVTAQRVPELSSGTPASLSVPNSLPFFVLAGPGAAALGGVICLLLFFRHRFAKKENQNQ